MKKMDILQKKHLIDLINHTDHLLSYVDRSYIYRAANEAYTRRYHRPLGEIIGRYVWEILGTELFETIVKPHLDQALNGESIIYEAWFDIPNVPKSYLIVTYKPSYNDTNEVEGVVVSVVDSTKLKILEEEKQKDSAIMAEVAKMVQLGEMISFISHQWRRPLNTLASYLLKIRQLTSSTEIIDSLHRSEEILDQLSNNLESLYALYSKGDAEVSCNINDVFEHLHSLIQERAKHSNVTLTLSKASPMMGMIGCRSDEFLHILMVMLDNALDALQDSYQESKQINMMVSESDKEIIIDIKDNGKGIAAADITNLFNPGFTTKGVSGQGYGLYFAQKILQERLQGSIELKSSSSEGSWFCIKIPILPHCE